MKYSDNRLLAFLSDRGGLDELGPHLTTVDLEQGQVLAHPNEDLRRVYFPHSGIISLVVQLRGGHVIQTGMVGRDGVVGAMQALDDKVSLNKIIVQIAGQASVLDTDRLRDAAKASSTIRSVLASHGHFLVADVQQSAIHVVEARVCRWLLRMNDLVGTDMHLTQELLAEMIGVTRPTVTMTASSLQSAGLITYRRGNLHIAEVEALKKRACECNQAVRSHYDRLFHYTGPDPST